MPELDHGDRDFVTFLCIHAFKHDGQRMVAYIRRRPYTMKRLVLCVTLERGAMLRAALDHEPLLRALLAKRPLLDALLGCTQIPESGVKRDAFATLHYLVTRHPDISSASFAGNMDWFCSRFNALMLSTEEFVVQSQTIVLMHTILSKKAYAGLSRGAFASADLLTHRVCVCMRVCLSRGQDQVHFFT
jgi:hypothetical protein